ncbi:hypothetical protein B0H19DRAFT_1224729 [Mycena capillaripes]|nr:hypothetical protein B0H19DRAFT_1224729 [Mycena capillaripes]
MAVLLPLPVLPPVHPSMAPLQSFDPNATIGALEIGVLASYVLFGVETTQAYIYYGRFPGDSLRIKVLVSALVIEPKPLINNPKGGRGMASEQILKHIRSAHPRHDRFFELGHVLSVGHSIYIVSVSDYGHPELFLRAPESMAVALLFSGAIVACVQGFFAFRIHRFSHSLFIPGLCGILAFLRLLGCVLLFVFAIRMESTIGWEMQWTWLLNSVWAISSSNDIILAVALTLTLYRQRSQSQNKRTVAVVDKIIKWTLETGVLTSLMGIVVLITFVTMKDKYIWVAGYMVATKLYSNTLFATLNSRSKLRAMDASVVLTSSPDKHGMNKSMPFVFEFPSVSETSAMTTAESGV